MLCMVHPEPNRAELRNKPVSLKIAILISVIQWHSFLVACGIDNVSVRFEMVQTRRKQQLHVVWMIKKVSCLKPLVFFSTQSAFDTVVTHDEKFNSMLLSTFYWDNLQSFFTRRNCRTWMIQKYLWYILGLCFSKTCQRSFPFMRYAEQWNDVLALLYIVISEFSSIGYILKCLWNEIFAPFFIPENWSLCCTDS